ncbi:DUF5663 domain-containing protein [Candidatus Saccharibacteria bacterium]|nr:DUF5663 domain-containing protein [Candidatus Saccharibacteria bacterium]
MFKLDDKFLEELGLAALPAEQKQAFLQHIYSELEIRVGERLTENMSDELLDEFGNFVDMNEAGMKKWFDENLPDYAERDDYKQLRSANAQAPETAVMSEYGAMKWLQLNRPDYPQVVAAVLEELKTEIRSNKDAILGGAMSGGQTASAAPASDQASADNTGFVASTDGGQTAVPDDEQDDQAQAENQQ